MPSTYAGSATHHASITIPDDADPITASSVNVALEQLKDETELLRLRGAEYFVRSWDASNEPANELAPASYPAWSGTTFAGGSYEILVNMSGLGVPVTGDSIDVVISCTLQSSRAASTVATAGIVRPFIRENSGTWTPVDGAAWNPTITVAAENERVTFAFKYPVVTGGTSIEIALNGRVDVTTDTPQLALLEGWTLRADIWRAP